MATVIDEMAAAQHGIVSRTQLRAHMSDCQVDRRIACGMLQRVHPGVYRVAGAPRTWEGRVMAATLAVEGAVASHRSAARLWGLPGSDSEMVEVSAPEASSVRRRGVRVHRVAALHPADRRVVHAVPVVAPELCLLQLAGIVPADALDGIVDDAIRSGLTTPARLRFRLHSIGGRGRRGAPLLRHLLELRATDDGPAASRLERRFLALVQGAGLPPPVLQHEVRGANGGVVAQVDAAWPEHGLVVELDGTCWHAPLDRWRADLERQNDLLLAGFRVLRLTWWDVHDRPDGAIVRLRRALARVGAAS